MKDNKWTNMRAALLGMVFIAMPGVAFAGFDWTPPPAPQPAAIEESMADGPLVPASPSAAVDSAELAPVVAVEAETPAPSHAVESTSVTAPSTYADAMGFGSEIPLAMALGQIVPPGFVYSFGENVNPGTLVSWNGGKPWDQVLLDALSSHELTATINGNSVLIKKAGAHPAEETAAQPAAPVARMTDPEAPVVRDAQSAAALESAEQADRAVMAPTAVTGEGTAEKYPRRAPRKNFIESIFGPADKPDAYDHQVEVENNAPPPLEATQSESAPVSKTAGTPDDVAVEEMSAVSEPTALESDSMAPVAASYEPAATTSPIPHRQSSLPPISRAEPHDVSYVQERAYDNNTDLTVPPPVASYATKVKASVLDPFEVRLWKADSQANLKDVLTSWAGNANVDVIWDSSYDYKLPGSISLQGTFPEAVTKILALYGNSEPRPQGRLHPNLPKGPSVLLIENYP